MEIKEVILSEMTDRKSYYDETCGAVYIAGYKNGTVKIGSTKDPWSRYEALKYDASNYSGSEIERFAISNPVEEYTGLEKLLHSSFKSKHIKRELFSIKFEDAIKKANEKFYYFENRTDTDEFIDIFKQLMDRLEKSGKNDEKFAVDLCTHAFRIGATEAIKLNIARGKQGPL